MVEWPWHQAEGISGQLILIPIFKGIPPDMPQSFRVQENQEDSQPLHLAQAWEHFISMFPRELRNYLPVSLAKLDLFSRERKLSGHLVESVRIYSWYPWLHTLFPFNPLCTNTSWPEHVVKLLIMQSLTHAYLWHEGYVVLVYCQDTPKGLQTTSHNSWTWINSHKGEKDSPKALCCWRMTIEDWDYWQQGKTLF